MLIKGPLRQILPDVAALIAACAVVFLSFVQLGLPSWLTSVSGGDKAGHLMAYACLGFCALYRRYRVYDSFISFAAVVSFGTIIELLQHKVGRTTDIGDFVANLLGAMLAWSAVIVLRYVRGRRLGRLAEGSSNSRH